MSTPIPNLTGGAATAGNIDSTTGLNFGPVNVGGLFGSSASSQSNLIPLLIAGGVIAFLLFRRK